MLYGDRLMRILAEEALCRLPNVRESEVSTPCGVARGLVELSATRLCLVSVVRSGDILQEAVRQLVPGTAVGKILIQRDEAAEDKRPILYYKKLPKDVAERFVMLVDPMLATAGEDSTYTIICTVSVRGSEEDKLSGFNLGSAKMAISVLVDSGVDPSNIMFLNLICAPEGLRALREEYPQVLKVSALPKSTSFRIYYLQYASYTQVQIITGAVDDCLNENRFIVPGLGDYGDRYYQTE